MIMEVKLNLLRKKQVTTMNRRIFTVTYFESRPLTSRPHLRNVSINYKRANQDFWITSETWLKATRIKHEQNFDLIRCHIFSSIPRLY